MNVFEFYRSHSALSDPGDWARELGHIPPQITAIVEAVQGQLLHDYFANHLYADPPADAATASRMTLPIADRVGSFHDIADMPLSQPGPPTTGALGHAGISPC